jgi:hypothetical protein
MKRTLTKSEKMLFIFCFSVIALVGGFFVWRNYRNRTIAAQEKIDNLQSRFTAAVAAAADAPFWKERETWIGAAMPAMGDAGQAHSSFLEHLQTTARQRGLSLAGPVLLKPEGGPYHRDLSISLQISGPDTALFRWLADLQSPEKFQMIKYMLLTPASAQPPRMTCSVTVARFYKP